MTPEQQFWKWFAEKENELFDFEKNQEAVFDQIARQLQKIDPDLSFEIGPKNLDSREFIISASGLKRAFTAVQKLVAAGPNLQRWHVVAFRPRRSPISIVEFRGKCAQPDGVQFCLLRKDKSIGLRMFIPGYSDADPDMKQIGYLLLDEALGEFDVETKIGLIQMLPFESSEAGERYPLRDLPKMFDQLFGQLNG